jgi:hypothetical protein
MVKQKDREARKQVTDTELYELGIYVQDYEMFISKQISEILPLVNSIPRSEIRNDGRRTVKTKISFAA